MIKKTKSVMGLVVASMVYSIGFSGCVSDDSIYMPKRFLEQKEDLTKKDLVYMLDINGTKGFVQNSLNTQASKEHIMFSLNNIINGKKAYFGTVVDNEDLKLFEQIHQGNFPNQQITIIKSFKDGRSDMFDFGKIMVTGNPFDGMETTLDTRVNNIKFALKTAALESQKRGFVGFSIISLQPLKGAQYDYFKQFDDACIPKGLKKAAQLTNAAFGKNSSTCSSFVYEESNRNNNFKEKMGGNVALEYGYGLTAVIFGNEKNTEYAFFNASDVLANLE
jgi:hypothetical protein